MITGEIKNRIDAIWDTFWTGGITNSITILEQMTYLFFMKIGMICHQSCFCYVMMKSKAFVGLFLNIILIMLSLYVFITKVLLRENLQKKYLAY